MKISETDSPGVQPELGCAAAALAALLALELDVGGVLDVVVRQQLLLRVELHVAGVAPELGWDLYEHYESQT